MFNKVMIIWLILLISAVPVLAGSMRVTAYVEGLACPFCTYNLEKRIKTLDGVPEELHWEASLENGWVSFDWNPDVPFDEAAVHEQISKAGFTPGKIEVTHVEE